MDAAPIPTENSPGSTVNGSVGKDGSGVLLKATCPFGVECLFESPQNDYEFGKRVVVEVWAEKHAVLLECAVEVSATKRFSIAYGPIVLGTDDERSAVEARHVVRIVACLQTGVRPLSADIL